MAILKGFSHTETKAAAVGNLKNPTTLSLFFLRYPPPPPKFNSSPLKNDGWKTILSFWDGNFSRANWLLNFQGGYSKLGGGFKHFCDFHPENWGRFPLILTSIFFRWVDSTTNQKFKKPPTPASWKQRFPADIITITNKTKHFLDLTAA